MIKDYRIGIRLIKIGVLLAVLGFIVEGLFEIRNFLQYFYDPPSIPGQGKIIEHFILQHIIFPLFGLCLVFRPAYLVSVVKNRAIMFILTAVSVVIFIPELIVSLRSDLFRPYPFDLKIPLLNYIQMIEFNRQQVNFLQLEHVILNHVLFTGIFVILLYNFQNLKYFSGPNTNKGFPILTNGK